MEDYRLLNIDGKEFYRVLKKKKGRDLAYDFKADVINTLKYSSVVGYIAVYDMTKVFDTMRKDRLETYMPLLATTLAFILSTFANWLAGEYKKNAILQGISFQRAEGDNLLFVAWLNYPESGEDEAV